MRATVKIPCFAASGQSAPLRSAHWQFLWSRAEPQSLAVHLALAFHALYYKASLLHFLPGARRIIERGNCKSVMSDLSPEAQPQPPRARRATRPKTKASTPRRSLQPASAPATDETLAESTPVQEDDPSLDQTIDEAPLPDVDEPPAEPPKPAGRQPIKLAGLTIISRPILVWAGVAGAGSFVFSLIYLLVLSTFGSTKADATANAGLLEGVSCLGFLVPPALAFFAGLRATAREGNGRIGAVAGLWSLIFLEVLSLILSVITLAVNNNLQGLLDGGSWAELGINFLFEGLILLAAGYFGGWFSERRRQRAQQQEALTSSS